MTIDLNIFNEGEEAEAPKVNENFQNLKAAIAESVNPLSFYTPKIIPAEEVRENTAYGTLTTPDEIQNVELAENGLILIGYQATVKESVNGAALMSIFLGTNQLKRSLSSGAPIVATASIGGETGKWVSLFSSTEYGITAGTGNATQYTGDVTTGQLVGGFVGSSIYGGGFALAFAAAGTYNVSVKFKASSGTVTAKDRRLWVATLG